MTIGFAMCGSFCTYAKVFPIAELLARDYQLIPIFSQSAYHIDSRFGSAKEHIGTITETPNWDIKVKLLNTSFFISYISYFKYHIYALTSTQPICLLYHFFLTLSKK